MRSGKERLLSGWFLVVLSRVLVPCYLTICQFPFAVAPPRSWAGTCFGRIASLVPWRGEAWPLQPHLDPILTQPDPARPQILISCSLFPPSGFLSER